MRCSNCRRGVRARNWLGVGVCCTRPPDEPVDVGMASVFDDDLADQREQMWETRSEVDHG